MNRILKVGFLCLFLLYLFPVYSVAEEQLMVFCGAAFKRPMDEVIYLFEKTTVSKIGTIYGGVGTLLAQMEFTKRGDVFISPSEDMMEKARKKGLVAGNSLRNIAYFVPCINVQKGNPKNIKRLKDLTREGIRVAIANPEVVYIGMLTAEIVDKNLTVQEKAAFKKNVVTHAEDFNKLAMFVALKQVDAVIGFHFLDGWYPDKIGTVKLNAREVQRIGAGQADIISFSQSKDNAKKFLDFLGSREAKAIFNKYHYFSTPEEAFKWIGEKKSIGGEYRIPADWIKK
ncbi:MAG: molybdate ABC transporter substrate-binding protein [Proteobacteria bacterium]|nr:molybdate ABC transporter substrate-binding protein [Pseudomonadota bacterium]